jgi:hypothetical protein
MKHSHNFRDVAGQTFGYLTAIKPTGVKLTFNKKQGRQMRRSVWLFKCICGNNVERTRKDVTNNKLKGLPSCGCQQWICGNNHGLWKGIGEIPKTYFNHIQREATKRKLKVDITLEYIWNLFLEQKRECSLSGVPLQFGTTAQVKHKREQTASLDRIDSTKGYVKGNVQWVHKTVNFMKQQSDQNDFIVWCKRIVERA